MYINIKKKPTDFRLYANRLYTCKISRLNIYTPLEIRKSDVLGDPYRYTFDTETVNVFTRPVPRSLARLNRDNMPRRYNIQHLLGTHVRTRIYIYINMYTLYTDGGHFQPKP